MLSKLSFVTTSFFYINIGVNDSVVLILLFLDHICKIKPITLYLEALKMSIICILNIDKRKDLNKVDEKLRLLLL